MATAPDRDDAAVARARWRPFVASSPCSARDDDCGQTTDRRHSINLGLGGGGGCPPVARPPPRGAAARVEVRAARALHSGVSELLQRERRGEHRAERRDLGPEGRPLLPRGLGLVGRVGRSRGVLFLGHEARSREVVARMAGDRPGGGGGRLSVCLFDCGSLSGGRSPAARCGSFGWSRSFGRHLPRDAVWRGLRPNFR